MIVRKMYRLVMTVFGTCLGLILTSPMAQADQVISFKSIPTDIVEYQELQQTVNTPEGAAGLFIMAMLAQEQSPHVSRAFMTLSLGQGQLVDGPNGYQGRQPDSAMSDHIKRLQNDPDIARSYVTGATPQNGYTLVDGDLTLYFTRNKLSVVTPNEIRVYVATSGAGTPRPVYMKRESDGIWRVAECSSLFVGIYAPSS